MTAAADPAASAVARAEALLDVGRAAQALAAVAAVPPGGDADADTVRAHCLLALGRHREAMQSLQAAVEVEPDHLGACLARSIVLAELRDPTGSLSAAERAVALAPDSTPAHFLLGLAQLRAGGVNAARRTADALVVADPQNALPHHLLGAVAQAQHDLHLAEHAYRASLAVDPDDAEVATALGEVLAGMGRTQESNEVLAGVIRSDPVESGRAKAALAGLGGGSVSLFLVFFTIAQLIRAGREVGYPGVAGLVVLLLVVGIVVPEVQARRRTSDLSKGLQSGVRLLRRESNLAVACAFPVLLVPVGLWGVLAPGRPATARLIGLGLLLLSAVAPAVVWRQRGGRTPRAAGTRETTTREVLLSLLRTQVDVARRRRHDRRTQRASQRYVLLAQRPRTRHRALTVGFRLMMEGMAVFFAALIVSALVAPHATWPPRLGGVGWTLVSVAVLMLAGLDGALFDVRPRRTKDALSSHRVVTREGEVPSRVHLALHGALRLLLAPLDLVLGAAQRSDSRLLHDRLVGTTCVSVRPGNVYDGPGLTGR